MKSEESCPAKLREAVWDYLTLLREGKFETAFFGLIDLDHRIVHPLIEAYRVEQSEELRADLFRIISELRSPHAIPLFSEALRDRRDGKWRGALDGLVTLASADAIEVLESALSDERARPNPDREYIEWVEEALDQCRQGRP